jgi:UDP-glucose 4-epimerase
MNILIIGSKGFIGTHVRRHFAPGHTVWGADVAVDYTDAHYLLVDATNPDFRALFETVPFDVCINCSGAASVPDSLNHPLRDYLLNTANVYRLLDAIRLHAPCCKFVNLSSAAVYGNPTDLPVSESAPTIPLSPYGLHKLAADSACKEYARFFGIRTCSLRIFSVYGNGLKKQLFWDLYQKSKQTEAMTLFGTGRESRDFIHVSDLARAIDLVCQKASFAGEAINVANGEEVFVENAVRLLLEALRWEGRIAFSGETRAGDPTNWAADISRLERIGYRPQKRLAEGLVEYATWARGCE